MDESKSRKRKRSVASQETVDASSTEHPVSVEAKKKASKSSLKLPVPDDTPMAQPVSARPDDLSKTQQSSAKRKKKKKTDASVKQPVVESSGADSAKRKKKKNTDASSISHKQPVVESSGADLEPAKKNKQKRNKTEESPGANASNEGLTVVLGGLPRSANETMVSKLFAKCGKIQKVSLPRDRETRQARGFAFLTFKTREGVDAALKLDGTESHGRRLDVRIAVDKSESNKCNKSEAAGKGSSDLSLFVGGLPHDITEKSLRKLFAKAGDIQSLKLPLNEAGKPKGFAFISLKDETSVELALELNGENGIAVRRSGQGGDKDGKGKGKGKDEKGKGSSKGKDPEFTVFVQGLTYNVKEKRIRKLFSECGEIVSLTLPMLDETQSRGFAFITFKDQAAVSKALELDGNTSLSYEDRHMSVKKAVKHDEAVKARENRQADGTGSAEVTMPKHKGEKKAVPKDTDQPEGGYIDRTSL
eukprot:TRINITY_DN17654_c0_g1_i1.p1 TRINITY_DN17654_c0_g1~~TRINITY_DN17654_c0_g1_i1.p1  ORF type:complete len:492 (-),score=86.71 TRINITY_DN17654_c0_g1_i1:316-1740(-)